MAEKEKKLESLSLEELLQRAEVDVKGFHWGYRDIFSAAIKKVDADQQPELAEQIRSEGILWDLQPDRQRGKRFGPMFTGTDENGGEIKYPDPSRDLPSARLDYYKAQLSKTANPRRKARYGDVLWEFRKDHEAARVAIQGYLDSAEVFFENEWDHELADAVGRAIILSLATNDSTLLEKTVCAAGTWVDQLLKAERPRWILEIAKTLVGSYRRVKDIFNFHNLDDTLTQLASHYADERKTLLEQGFLSTILELKTAMQDPDGVRAAKIQIAQAFEREGDFKKENYPKGNLVAAHFYENALHAYEKAGKCNEEMEQLKVKIQKANQAAADEMEMISTTVEIKKNEIDEFIKPYEGRTPVEILRFLSVDPRIAPSQKEARNLAVENSKKYILSHLMPTTIIRNGITVKNVVGEEEKLEQATIQNYQLSYQITANTVLSPIFKKLNLAESDSWKALEDYLAATEIVAPDRRRMILHGFDRYRKDDYISTIHILPFQIEGLLRDLLEKAGLPIFKKSQAGEMRAKTLWDCLEALRNGSGIDVDLLDLIQIFLNEVSTENLRNEIAHGLADPGACNRRNAELLMYILIRLGGYGVKQKTT